MPEYSFIIPLKNGEKTIQNCLSSVLKQYGDFEVIVVDNGSTDSGALFASRFPGVQVVSCLREGPGAARNFGSELARGKFLAFVDADVELADGWLTEVTQYLQDTPVDFLATSVIPSLGNDIVDEFRYFFAYFKSHGKFLSIRKRNSLAPVINTAASVCLAASFNEAGKFNEDLRHNEDMDLSVRMFFNGMNLGACSNARSVVKFEATHRTLAYLKRSFVKRFFSLSDSVPFLESVLPQIRTARKKSLGLKIFIICNEIAGQLGGMGGRVFPGPRNLRKKVQAGWKVKLGKKFERFHFFEGSNFYFPRKDHFFLFMDESVHLLKLPGLASSIIDPGISPALRKLNRGVALNESDISILRKLDSFEVFGETTCSN